MAHCVETLSPSVVISAMKQYNAPYQFPDLLRTLEELGLTETAARDLIWELLATGVVRFDADRQHLLLSRSADSEG